MYNEDEHRLKEKLEVIHNSGVDLFLEGSPASPEMIAYTCVREENIYMADYVLGDDGTLKELRYDKVTDW